MHEKKSTLLFKISIIFLSLIVLFKILYVFADDLNSESIFIISASNGTLVANEKNHTYALNLYRVDPLLIQFNRSADHPANFVDAENFLGKFQKNISEQPKITHIKIIAIPLKKNGTHPLFYNAIIKEIPSYNKKKHTLSFTLMTPSDAEKIYLPNRVSFKHVALLIGDGICVSCPGPP